MTPRAPLDVSPPMGGGVSDVNVAGTSPRARLPSLSTDAKGARPRDSSQGANGSSPIHHPSDPSLIFERDVQEATLSPDVAPDIPAHIKTEDQIPPALEASSLAITDSHLSPEEVEIVTHIAHQPAAATLAHGTTSPLASETNLSNLSGDASPDAHNRHLPAEADDGATGYGALDPNDVRRLSFISFADVVQAEHAEHADSAHSLQQNPAAIIPLDAALANHAAAASPRSPISEGSQPLSSGTITPPTSGSGPMSNKGFEQSPSRSTAGSPIALSPHLHGDLSIETLGQALRKTASREFNSLGRSPPSSAV